MNKHLHPFDDLKNESFGKVIGLLLGGLKNLDNVDITILDNMPERIPFDMEVLCPFGEPLAHQQSQGTVASISVIMSM